MKSTTVEAGQRRRMESPGLFFPYMYPAGSNIYYFMFTSSTDMQKH